MLCIQWMKKLIMRRTCDNLGIDTFDVCGSDNCRHSVYTLGSWVMMLRMNEEDGNKSTDVALLCSFLHLEDNNFREKKIGRMQ